MKLLISRLYYGHFVKICNHCDHSKQVGSSFQLCEKYALSNVNKCMVDLFIVNLCTKRKNIMITYESKLMKPYPAGSPVNLLVII